MKKLLLPLLLLQAVTGYSQMKQEDVKTFTLGNGMKFLVVDDSATMRRIVINSLQRVGFTNVVEAADGLDALDKLDATIGFVITDWNMPNMGGLDLVKSLRTAGDNTPVLFLTALGGVEDRVSGLNAGGDDYLVKPFAFSELVARVAALGRRPHTTAAETKLHVLDLELDLLARTVWRGGELIELQPREFRLLEYLMRHAGQVVTRTMLLEHVWDIHFDPRTNVVESHISRLRSKVDKGFGAELIHTVRGAGYCVRSPT